MLAAKGETSRAGYVMNRMLADYPDFVGTYSEGAEVLVIEGRISEAVKWLDRGLAKFPNHPVLMNDRGMCHLLLADLPAAKADFEVAYQADTDDSEYVANLALAHADLVTLIRDGEVAASGRPVEVLQPENLQRVFGIEATLLHPPGWPHPVIATRSFPE